MRLFFLGRRFRAARSAAGGILLLIICSYAVDAAAPSTPEDWKKTYEGRVEGTQILANRRSLHKEVPRYHRVQERYLNRTSTENVSTQSAYIGGSGNNSCGEWTIARRSGKEAMLEWVMGYVTGVNAWGSNNGNVTQNAPGDSLFLWLDNYCQEHPLQRVGDAVFELIMELGRRSH